MCFEAGTLMWFLGKLFATHMPYAFCETKNARLRARKTLMPFWIILAFSFAGRRQLFCSVSFRQVFEYFIPRDLCSRLAPSPAANSYIFCGFGYFWIETFNDGIMCAHLGK